MMSAARAESAAAATRMPATMSTFGSPSSLFVKRTHNPRISNLSRVGTLTIAPSIINEKPSVPTLWVDTAAGIKLAKVQTGEVKGIEKVGGEDCYKVEFTPEKGTKVTDFYSTKTFLLMKRRGVSVSGTSDVTLPYSVTFSDYREVDGIKLPFKSVSSNPAMGETIVTVKSVKHNTAIDDKNFAPRKLNF